MLGFKIIYKGTYKPTLQRINITKPYEDNLSILESKKQEAV